MQQEAETVIEEKQADALQPAPNPARTLYEWVETLIWCFLSVVILFTFLLRVVGVKGSSMTDTLRDGDRLVTIDYVVPKYGDIVAVTQPKNLNEPLVKRVIATEGQTVDIDFNAGVVYVDGVKLEEAYTLTPTNVRGDINYPAKVPAGHVFVMGDNRNGSKDSRFKEVGMVDVRYIFGRIVLRLFPFNSVQLF